MSLLKLDKAATWNIIGYGVSAAAAPLSAFLIVRFFSPEAQGFYYTFNSILALQVFFELGFAYCITQFTSHEFAKLRFDENFQLEGDECSLARILSIGKKALYWYAVISFVFFLGLGIVGEYFFGIRSHPGIDWRTAWWLLCLGTAVLLILTPIFSFINGCNQVEWTARARIIQNVVRTFSLVGFLALGSGLYAPAIASLISGGITSLILLKRWRPLLAQVIRGSSIASVSWWHEMWPFQWRIAVSSISGYLSFSAFNPILFARVGSSAAGQFGITWALISAVSGIAQVFINAKQPQFGMLFAQGKFSDLKKLFSHALAQSLFFAVLLLGSLAVAIEGASLFPMFHSRFLNWTLLLPLLFATLLNQLTFSIAALARANKQEPFLWPSITSGILTVSAAWYLSGISGILGVSLSYLAIALLMALWAVLILRSVNSKMKSDGQ